MMVMMMRHGDDGDVDDGDDDRAASQIIILWSSSTPWDRENESDSIFFAIANERMKHRHYYFLMVRDETCDRRS